jgi:hypothetical protein
MANKRISELPDATLPLVSGAKFEVLQGGLNVKIDVDNLPGTGLTREFDRAFSSELLFDKNEIAYTEHELTGDLNYTVALTGHLVNEFSSATQIVETDGTRTVTFTGFNFVLGDIQSGSIPEAGTYLVLFIYWNGVSTVNWTKPSLEAANLTALSQPANFTAVVGTDPETEIDLAWDVVANVVEYQIKRATDVGGPFTLIQTITAGTETYTDTGRTSNTQYFYQNIAVGDGVLFSNSQPATANATTEDSGDTTAPTFVFLPANSATDIPMNRVATITASEAILKTDATEITNANVAALLTVKVDNISGADIPFTATIDVGKTIITITPNVVWPATDQVFIQIAAVEDVNGNHSSVANATFTTNDYTEMSGNYLNLGSQFNSIVTGNDIDFELEYEFKDAVFSGYKGLFQKENLSDNKSFIFSSGYESNNNVAFTFYTTLTSFRVVKWANALAGVTSGKITLKYFGAVDTNNGLDRCFLYLDDVLVGAKTVQDYGGAAWPFAIAAGSASLYISGATYRQVKNAFIRNNSGATIQGSYPVLRTGLDTSGNARHGTWI